MGGNDDLQLHAKIAHSETHIPMRQPLSSFRALIHKHFYSCYRAATLLHK